MKLFLYQCSDKFNRYIGEKLSSFPKCCKFFANDSPRPVKKLEEVT